MTGARVAGIVSCALLTLSSFTAPALAQMYKWVDQNGKTQYSDSPPPASAKARAQVVKPPPPVQPGAQPAPDWQEQQQAFERRQAARDNAEQQQAAKNAADRAAACAKAKSAAQQLQAAEGHRLLVPAGDSSRFVGDDERTDMKKRTQKAIADNC